MEKLEDGELEPKQTEKSEAELKAERELLKRIVRKDEDAFGQFFIQCYPDVESAIDSKFKEINEADAQDIVIESFERLWAGVLSRELQVESFSKLKGYVYTTAYNLSIDFLNKKKRIAEAESESGMSDEQHFNEVGQMTYKAEMLNKIEAAIQKLSERDRKVIELYYWQQKTFNEIAGLLKIEYENVKKIKGRAEDKIIKIIKIGIYLCALFKGLQYVWHEISHYF